MVFIFIGQKELVLFAAGSAPTIGEETNYLL